MEEQYSLKDVKELYKRHIYPVTKQRPRVKFRINVIRICKSFDLPFRECGEDVYFDSNVYNLLTTFYVNQSNYLKGHEDYLSLTELCKMLGVNRSKFGETQEAGDWRKRHWKNLIQFLDPQMYYIGQFWFSLIDANNLKDKLDNSLDPYEIQTILLNEYGKKITIQYLNKKLKEFSDQPITLLGKRTLYSKAVIEELTKEYLTLKEASELLGTTSQMLGHFIRDKKLFPDTKTVKGSNPKIDRNDVNKWLRFKEETVSLFDILVEVLPQYYKDMVEPYSQSNTLITIRKILLKEKKELKIIPAEKTPLRSAKWWVYKENEARVIEAIKEIIFVKTHRDRENRFEIYIKKNFKNTVPITIKEFHNFAIRRFKSRINLSFPVIKFIYDHLLQLPKELTEHTDGEIQSLINELNDKQNSNEATLEFIIFLNDIQKKHKTNFTGKYTRKYKDPKNKQEVMPYSKEQFFRFGILLLNDTHDWYKDYLNKALEKRVYANTWLFCLLHYVCAWRASDLLQKIPFPSLPQNKKTREPMSADEFFITVKEGLFTEQMALEIVSDIKMKIEFLNVKPSKTSKSNPPNLVWEIPESVIFRLGMLLGLCEAHRQKRSSANSLIVNKARTVETQAVFFGEDFIDIFKGNAFINSRGNKTFEILMAKKADEEQLGSGYIIASVARSHKFTPGRLSNTTSIYLDYFGELTGSEVLLRELFERGVCSFVPYLLLKTLQGEEQVQQLAPNEQTAAINTLIPYSDSPYDIEMLVKTYNDVMIRAKREVEKVIEHYTENEKTDKDGIYKFLDRIACGTSAAKQKNMNCISVAKGLGCLYPSRKDCIGCGQEIYLKTSLHVLGKKIRKLIERTENSKTINEKVKSQLISQKVLKPILNDIVITLVTNYSVKDMSEYQEILMGLSADTVKDS
ncbi:hypothetical protein M3181_21965 [Mesobacillus maritimus]|uniref:hypothetical protein n=1 Tax=Mesobacillus maritimus TaxID=1643336 RepID=UPI00203E2E81|nr:hypothetical protein [Mesobacillus maritimus]MCM3671626.1 hypothetical protein [Mesobacillus maritimus]